MAHFLGHPVVWCSAN